MFIPREIAEGTASFEYIFRISSDRKKNINYIILGRLDSHILYKPMHEYSITW